MGRYRSIVDVDHPQSVKRAGSDPVGPACGPEVAELATAALRALTKASRACLLYDFDNEAVADFLRELGESMGRVLARGSLTLTVRPWELVCADRVVYSEHDREKSLAFRLHNDGVRSMTFHPEITWDEITRLVAILSVRYSEVRLQEEDVVTMLWKASFAHLTVEAVDSYTPVDDEEVADARSRLRELVGGGLDEDSWQFDSPCPELHRGAEVVYRPLSEQELEPLLAEEDPAALPASCLHLIRPLLAAAADPEDPLELDLMTPLVREIRDFLLSEGNDQALLEAVRLTHQGARALADSPQRTALLGVFTEREAFARMLDAAIADAAVPEALLELAAVAPVDELEVLLQVLASRWSGAGRDLGRAILGDGIGGRLRLVAEQVLTLPPAILGDILELVVERDPELATVLAVALLRRRDRTARLHAVDALERLPYRGEVGRALAEEALADEDVKVCGRAAEVLAAKGERRAAPALRRALEKGLTGKRSAADLGPLVTALVCLDEEAALELVAAWTGGPHSRTKLTDSTECRLALRGLALISGEEAARRLAAIHSRSDGELRGRCVQAMAQQREAGGGG